MSTPNEKLNEMLKMYLSNLNKYDRTQGEMEIEAKFGKFRHISRIDYENIVKYLKSKGWKNDSNGYLLRIQTESMDLNNGNIRTEMDDIHTISEYCKTDSIVDRKTT